MPSRAQAWRRAPAVALVLAVVAVAVAGALVAARVGDRVFAPAGVSCADFPSRGNAQRALAAAKDGDHQDIVRAIDADGDGRACERSGLPAGDARQP